MRREQYSIPGVLRTTEGNRSAKITIDRYKVIVDFNHHNGPKYLVLNEKILRKLLKSIEGIKETKHAPTTEERPSSEQ